MKSIGTRLAVYSKVKPTAKAIREAYKTGQPMDLEITDIMSPYCGSYASPAALKAAGYTSVTIRFDRDRKVLMLDLTK